jgi:regulator of replication initiation timing
MGCSDSKAAAEIDLEIEAVRIQFSTEHDGILEQINELQRGHETLQLAYEALKSDQLQQSQLVEKDALTEEAKEKAEALRAENVALRLENERLKDEITKRSQKTCGLGNVTSARLSQATADYAASLSARGESVTDPPLSWVG